MELENAYPFIYNRGPDRVFTEKDFNSPSPPVDAQEVFDHIRDIKDPEHPMSLEELGVVDVEYIKVDDEANLCCVAFKPTIPHCSLATLIGLAIKVHLLRVMPPRFKCKNIMIDVCIIPDSHVTYIAINKQLADKERIAAALENLSLSEVINDCLLLSEPQTLPEFVEMALEKAGKLDHPMVLIIRKSRQHIESYRRWNDIINSKSKRIVI